MKNWIGLLLCTVTITMWVGCGGGSGSGGGGTTPPGISVSFSTAPPASLQVGGTAQVAATVANDSSTNGGVDWSCAPASACGSFNPAHTASAAATTYTAPSTVPSGGSVTITATSTADSAASISGKTTITSPAITFNPAAPASLDVNQTQSLTAVVTNDSSKAGVDWSCSPIGTCGTFNPTHTASGVATVYTAPAGAVTARVKATSTANASISTVANITIFGVKISFYPQPTPSLLTTDPNATPVSVAVSHDVTNAGATWSCSGDCGTLGAGQTGCSLCSNTYIAASTPGQATITVTSIADPTQMVSAIITQSATFGASTIGTQAPGGDNYVFQTAGIDAHGPYQLTGVLTADGAGNITGGEQHYSNTVNVYIDSISSGSYTIGADGRGTITLNTGDTNVGVAGVETLGLVVIDGTKGLITQFDTSATSSGTLDLQTPKSQLSGGYAFVTSGVNIPGKPLGFGGIINIDSPGTISGKGSVADDIDNVTQNLGQTLSGTVANPDPLGKSVFNLTTSFTNQNVALVAYIIDNTHVKLIENDTYGSTAGAAFGQGPATGTFTNTNFPTAVVFETEGLSTPTFVPTVYAGLFAATGGSITGVADENAGGTVTTGATGATLTGNYAADSSKTGRVTTSNMLFNGVTGPTWVFYLTGDPTTPALVLQVDKTPVETAGALYSQTVPGGGFIAGSFDHNYATNFTAFPTGAGEDDGTGQVIADGASALTGTMDTNYDFAPSAGETLSGTFAAVSNGRFTGTLTEGAAFSSSAMAFYLVDNTRAVFIETDTTQPAIGVFRLQEQ